jgi:hypothetical protein
MSVKIGGQPDMGLPGLPGLPTAFNVTTIHNSVGKVLKVEPTEPTEPAKPTEPTEPTEPTKPTDPTLQDLFKLYEENSKFIGTISDEELKKFEKMYTKIYNFSKPMRNNGPFEYNKENFDSYLKSRLLFNHIINMDVETFKKIYEKLVYSNNKQKISDNDKKLLYILEYYRKSLNHLPQIQTLFLNITSKEGKEFRTNYFNIFRKTPRIFFETPSINKVKIEQANAVEEENKALQSVKLAKTNAIEAQKLQKDVEDNAKSTLDIIRNKFENFKTKEEELLQTINTLKKRKEQLLNQEELLTNLKSIANSPKEQIGDVTNYIKKLNLEISELELKINEDTKNIKIISNDANKTKLESKPIIKAVEAAKLDAEDKNNKLILANADLNARYAELELKQAICKLVETIIYENQDKLYEAEEKLLKRKLQTEPEETEAVAKTTLASDNEYTISPSIHQKSQNVNQTIVKQNHSEIDKLVKDVENAEQKVNDAESIVNEAELRNYQIDNLKTNAEEKNLEAIKLKEKFSKKSIIGKAKNSIIRTVKNSIIRPVTKSIRSILTPSNHIIETNYNILHENKENLNKSNILSDEYNKKEFLYKLLNEKNYYEFIEQYFKNKYEKQNIYNQIFFLGKYLIIRILLTYLKDMIELYKKNGIEHNKRVNIIDNNEKFLKDIEKLNNENPMLYESNMIGTATEIIKRLLHMTRGIAIINLEQEQIKSNINKDAENVRSKEEKLNICNIKLYILKIMNPVLDYNCNDIMKIENMVEDSLYNVFTVVTNYEEKTYFDSRVNRMNPIFKVLEMCEVIKDKNISIETLIKDLEELKKQQNGKYKSLIDNIIDKKKKEYGNIDIITRKDTQDDTNKKIKILLLVKKEIFEKITRIKTDYELNKKTLIRKGLFGEIHEGKYKEYIKFITEDIINDEIIDIYILYHLLKFMYTIYNDDYPNFNSELHTLRENIDKNINDPERKNILLKIIDENILILTQEQIQDPNFKNKIKNLSAKYELENKNYLHYKYIEFLNDPSDVIASKFLYRVMTFIFEKLKGNFKFVFSELDKLKKLISEADNMDDKRKIFLKKIIIKYADDLSNIWKKHDLYNSMIKQNKKHNNKSLTNLNNNIKKSLNKLQYVGIKALYNIDENKNSSSDAPKQLKNALRNTFLKKSTLTNTNLNKLNNYDYTKVNNLQNSNKLTSKNTSIVNNTLNIKSDLIFSEYDVGKFFYSLMERDKNGNATIEINKYILKLLCILFLNSKKLNKFEYHEKINKRLTTLLEYRANADFAKENKRWFRQSKSYNTINPTQLRKSTVKNLTRVKTDNNNIIFHKDIRSNVRDLLTLIEVSINFYNNIEKFRVYDKAPISLSPSDLDNFIKRFNSLPESTIQSIKSMSSNSESLIPQNYKFRYVIITPEDEKTKKNEKNLCDLDKSNSISRCIYQYFMSKQDKFKLLVKFNDPNQFEKLKTFIKEKFRVQSSLYNIIKKKKSLPIPSAQQGIEANPIQIPSEPKRIKANPIPIPSAQQGIEKILPSAPPQRSPILTVPRSKQFPPSSPISSSSSPLSQVSSSPLSQVSSPLSSSPLSSSPLSQVSSPLSQVSSSPLSQVSSSPLSQVSSSPLSQVSSN